jgi:hypothetical protein
MIHCLFITDQQKVFRSLAFFVLPSHCTKDVYTPQGSTRDCGQYVEHRDTKTNLTSFVYGTVLTDRMARFSINYDVQADWEMNVKAIRFSQVEDETRLTAV